MRILITEFMDAAAVAQLKQQFEVEYDADLVDRRPELLTKLAEVDALIVRNRTRVDTQLLAAASRLRVVGRLGVGLDNIDVSACQTRGIAVFPATGANALAVAEYVVATVMLLLRGAYLSSAEMLAGQWPRPRLSQGRETADRTLGLIGFGGIGQLTARLAIGLGMRVLAYDPPVPSDAPVWAASGVIRRELDELLAEADAVSLHVPLTAQTRGLMDAARIGRMKAQAVLINTSRGGIVDEAALAAALSSGKLGGAALDVFEREPLAQGSALASAPNLILTPHIAGVTHESNIRVSTMIAAKVASFLQSV